MYGLMYPELRTLRAGYEVEQELQEQGEAGVSQGERAGLSEFSQELESGEWTPDSTRTAHSGSPSTE